MTPDLAATRPTLPAPARAALRSGQARGDRLDWRGAAREYARAARLAPGDALPWANLAHALLKQGRLDEAAAAAERARAIAPADVAVALSLSECRRRQERWPEACDTFVPAIGSPFVDHALMTLHAQSLYNAGRWRDALDAAMAAVALKLDHAPAHAWMAYAFDKLSMPQQALECMRTAHALAPGNAAVLTGLIHYAQKSCDWSTLEADVARLGALIERDAGDPANPFHCLMMDLPASTQLEVSRRFASRHPAPRPGPAQTTRPQPDGRIAIGYLSSDFQEHATTALLSEVIEQHDRDRFRIVLYSCGPDDGSAMRRRVVAAAERFVDFRGVDDEAAARRIRDDRIDVLVDLKGYTFGCRLGIVARRPAPVQVNWLGYPSSMGHDAIDYFIGDPVATPPGSERLFSEALALMPHSYQPNDRQRPIAERPSRADCGLPQDAFVFCCFNMPQKFTPRVFDVWCELLRALPGSVLWLLEANPTVRGHLQREAAARGVDPARLVFAPLLPLARHLARASLADLFLDTLPCNAHTTASDALWAGVPVLTCASEHFASRVAASLLHAVGLPELVTTDLAAYRDAALALARDPARLGALRARLARARDEAPLFDSARFARDLEALYVRMVERHRAGLPPARLELSAAPGR